jgi:cyclophilin family peptidyl-prolyl cis-trans isomerase/protein-disulfide isomerase
MKRLFWVLLPLAAGMIFLSACAVETGATLTATLVIPTIPNTPTPAVSCSVINFAPTPTPGVSSYFPPVSGADYSYGPVNAPVTIVEYCDFQSSGCRATAIFFGRLLRSHENVRFVFRPLPLLGIMDKSDKAVIAAIAAGEQDQFWNMYDLLFLRYDEWVNLTPDAFETWVVSEASLLGLDGEKLKAAIHADETESAMRSMHEAAASLNIAAVPLILINGSPQPADLLDYRTLSDTIGLISLGQNQFTECPPFDIDPSKQYIATIETEKGDIVMQLFPDKAPLAVNSFVFLAKQGWFDGVMFHRVIPGFAAQAGDPSGTGRGNPGYFFNTEISDLRFDKPGMVGMANSGADLNGSQFFITLAPAPHLDGGYTIFGQVLSGLDVVERLTPRDPEQPGILPDGDRIIHVGIEVK